MYKKWNLFIILTLLLGLVFTRPAQIVVAAVASATADFIFTSSPNPSNFGQEVTFSLSATGSDPTYPPFGYVNFYDNETEIEYCHQTTLNYPNSSSPQAGQSAICKTSILEVGTHTITAKFSSIISSIYADDTIVLNENQIVDGQIPLRIEPTSLIDAIVNSYYQMQFIAYYPDETPCDNCSWWSGLEELPESIGLFGETGELLGTPTSEGIYNFTVYVDDHNGASGSQNYSLHVTKAKAIVDVDNATTFVGNTNPITLGATVHHSDLTFSPQPTGKISFSVSGVPVPGCSGVNAKSTDLWGHAECGSFIPTGLAVGSYQIQVNFTPDAASSTTYMSSTGTGALQVNAPQAIVSGRVFLDDNKNAKYDEGEAAQGNWNVFLNQDCDGFLEGNVVTDPYTGGFSFEPVPLENTYCLFVDLTGYTGYEQTTPYNNLTLSDYQYFEIGVYYPHITILPFSQELQSGSVGTYYEQLFEISGGTEPYTIEPTAALPAGLAFDKNMLSLSGTPTVGGMGQLNLYVTDSNGLSASREYSFRIMADGDFTFTSSSNPSSPGEAVTFMVSASGEADTQIGKLPPTGFVTFFADENEIVDCSFLYLNVVLDDPENPVFGNYPVTCTTDALGEGSHEISAIFVDPFEIYNQPTLSLTQQVGVVSSLAISPETLAFAAYQTPYSQQLTASGGTEPYTFTLLNGSLPNGINLRDDGLLSGFADFPAAPGTYPLTVQVIDANGVIASRNYDFVLDKGMPEVTIRTDANISWHIPFSVSAEVLKKTSDGNFAVLNGTVAFYIDDIPVPGCNTVTEMDGYYHCANVSMDLSVGTHTLKADYTPTDWYTGYYYPGSGSVELTMQPISLPISGSTFMDANQNGSWGEGESKITGSDWTINLDQGCDGEVDYSTNTVWGNFSFNNFSVSGQCHRISVVGAPGYQQTTQLEDFIPVPGTPTIIMVGFYYPTITLSPSEHALPSSIVGVEYNQEFSASGGTGPYTFTVLENYFSALPVGLTLSAEGVLSGTPTEVSYSTFIVKATDANGAIGQSSYSLTIEQVKIDGDFTFTSSSNPSTLSEVVTFTVSASGAAETPLGVLPPTGVVTFLVDGTEISGCSNLYLNLLLDENGIPMFGNYPVTCVMDALGEGSHEITATYYDLLNAYNQPTLALTQVVNASVSADLSISNADSKDPVKPGSKLLYTLTVSNLGADLAESVIVTDKLDVNTTYLSVSAPRGWSCSYVGNSGTVTCTTDSLASGSSAIIKITVMVNKTAKVGKELVNNAFVSSATFDPNLSNNSVVQKTLVAK